MTASGQCLREGLLLGMGNPLLDLIAVADEDFLEKYGMKANDAILAEEKHIPMYNEMVEKYKCEFVAGGACLNALKATQWVLGTPNVTVFMGCIGKDKFGAILENKAKEVGVDARFMYDEKVPTGTCAVVVTGHDRSLCANLSAANCFKISHIQKPENMACITNAAYYYLTSFFLTVSPDSMLEVARHANNNNKKVFLNLSAPFLIQFFREPMMQVLPHVDAVFGNETEAAAFAKEHKFGTEDLKEVARKMTNFLNTKREGNRMVVITQGPGPIIVAIDDAVTEYEVPELRTDQIVDTNGAGDAFAGGFLAMYIQEKPIEVCVRCGVYAAVQVIQQSGCTYPPKCDFKPEV